MLPKPDRNPPRWRSRPVRLRLRAAGDGDGDERLKPIAGRSEIQRSSGSAICQVPPSSRRRHLQARRCMYFPPPITMFPVPEIGKPHHERMSRDHDMAVVLHTQSERGAIEGVSGLRAVAIVVNELARFIMDENIPACIPNIGWDYKEPYDYSRIVYYPSEPLTKE